MPIDNPLCVALFLKRWRPQVGILMETPFFPNLVLVASLFGVRLSLLNAHIPSMELLHWHAWKGLRRLLGAVLDKFVLIVPASDVVSEGCGSAAAVHYALTCAWLDAHSCALLQPPTCSVLLKGGHVGQGIPHTHEPWFRLQANTHNSTAAPCRMSGACASLAHAWARCPGGAVT